MNSMELIDEAIKFQRNNSQVRKRVGEWLQSLDMDGLTDLQEQLTEVIYENQGDEYVYGALLYLREYVEAEIANKAKGALLDLFKKKFNLK